MERVSVVGISGSGKSTLARRIAERMGVDVPVIELDAIHHLPDWEPIDDASFIAELERRTTETERWVVDGNYRVVVKNGPVWERADTVVWLHLPRRTVMRHIVVRSIRRVVTREALWNGNRERLRNLVAWDPRKSVIRWAWTGYGPVERQYAEAMADPARAHLAFVHLRSHAEADAWLAGLGSGQASPSRPAT